MLESRPGRRARLPPAARLVASLAIRPDGQQLASVGGTESGEAVEDIENGQPWTAAGDQPLPEMKGDLRLASRTCSRGKTDG